MCFRGKLFLPALWFGLSAAVWAGDCRGLLSSPTPDQKFAAYFSELLEEGVLGTEELAAYLGHLEAGEIDNPVTEEVALSNWGAGVHRESLQEYVDGGVLTLEWQREWARGKLAELEGNRERRRVAREDTRVLPLEIALPGVRMIALAGGVFTMGSPWWERGRNKGEGRVEVELSPFEAMDIPVTEEMWVAVMGGEPSRYFYFQKKQYRANPLVVGMGGTVACPNHPVKNVTWNDVQVFLDNLNRQLGVVAGTYRLPTEAEWEYMARAGTTTAYWFGNDPKDLEKYAVYDDDHTRPVRLRPSNPWGFHDVHGNVWEWTRDWYRKKLPGGRDPWQSHPAEFRVIRGGSWNTNAQYLRSANRGCGNPGHSLNVGLRVVRTLTALDK